jgi:Domain of unknown function (DUF4383)
MASAASSRTPAQLFALVFGIVYVAVGLLGFAVTGFDNFFSSSANEVLIIFPLNPAHNIVHLLLGAIWIGSARSLPAAKTVNLAIGAAYLLVFLLGLVGALQWLSIEPGVNADALLHLLSGGLSVYFGTAGAARTSTATA